MTPGMLPLVASCHFEVLWKTFSDHLSGYRQPLVLLFVLYTEISYPACTQTTWGFKEASTCLCSILQDR